jgi:hypothetical protein
LFVISSGYSEDVTLVLVSHDFTVDFLTHASVKERTTIEIKHYKIQEVSDHLHVFFFIDFDLFVATCGGVGNIELNKN